jgi:hypothetical protein
MPFAARGLKKNRGGHWASTICERLGWETGDDEHPTSSLRNPVLRVDSPPLNVYRPAFGQRIEHRGEISTTGCAVESGDVLKESHCWKPSIRCLPHVLDDPDELEK